MEQIHTPVKGISADIEPAKRDSLTWDFPTEGIRILNRDGQGMICTLMPGNSVAEGDETPAYQVTDNFIVIGACAYNGVIYLASVNASTGEGELGSFPGMNYQTGAYEDKYFPLSNLMAGTATLITNPNGRIPFRTTKLNFSVGSQIEMFAAPSYDMSVDLFMCDFIQPNLVINSGFTSGQAYNVRTYNDNSFPYGVRMIQHTDKYPTASIQSLTDNGNNMPGNYYLFFRYVTDSMDRTAFLTELGPISVHIGTIAQNIEGVVDELSEATNKAINLQITDLDPNYKYIEIGVWRYHGPHISAAVREEYCIYKYYNITGSTMNITITGNEEHTALTVAEVMNTNTIPPICKSHTTAGNRYLGANWKDISINKEALRIFAGKIYASPIYNDLLDMKVADYESGISSIPQYKDIHNIHKYRSNMRGEIYPYGVVFVYTTGRESDVFPIASADFTISTAPIYDGKGLVRMPDFVAGTGLEPVNDLTRPLGVWMNTQDAVNYLNNNADSFANIAGYYFVRGERKVNTLYQGFAMPCVNKLQYGDKRFGEYVEGTYNPDQADSLYFPVIKSYALPYVGDALNAPCAADKKRYALYSPDYIFLEEKKLTDLNKYHVKIITQELLGAWQNWKSSINVLQYQHNLFEYDPASFIQYYFAPAMKGLATIKNTAGGRFKEGANWSTLFLDKNLGKGQFAYDASYNGSAIYNKSIKSQRYIGIELDDQTVDLSHRIVAIQKYASPDIYWNTVQNDFNLATEDYNRIGQLFKLNEQFYYPVGKNVLYEGDIFLNRTIFRAWHWYEIPTAQLSAADYPHGMCISLLSENTVNTQMRNDTIADVNGTTLQYTYFPKCLENKSTYPNLRTWAVTAISDEVIVEAIYVNSGYNKVDGGRQYRGHNAQLPSRIEVYPDRVYASSKQIPGAYTNGYRIFGIDSYKDYSWEDGPINSIRELFGRLVLVCDNAITEVLFNESQYRVPTSQGELLLGTADVLAPVGRKLAAYGSRHTHGICGIDSGYAGVDSDRLILWRIIPGEGGLVVENMSQKYQVQSQCKKIFALIKGTGVIGDSPSWGDGIKIGYDPYFKEIFFTITKNGSRTIMFSEEINAFLGTAPFASGMYIHNGLDFFSGFNRALGSTSVHGYGLYRHNNEDVPMVFYGTKKAMCFSIIVNGLVEGQNTSTLRKIFKAGSIVSGPEPFEKIEIETQFQKGTLDPFYNTAKFWQSAAWNNNMWEYSLPLQDSADNDQFNTETDMRGTWARITFWYNSTKKTFIQSIRTIFNITNS